MVVLSRVADHVRYACRLARRTPAFVAVVVLVLGVAIGANTAAFSLVDALLLRPLPVRAPGQLVRVASTAMDGGISYPEYLDYRSATASLSDLLAFTASPVGLGRSGGAEMEEAFAYLVTPNYFSALGVDVVRGRAFDATADPRSAEVVLSDTYWRTRFGADPGVVGRTVWVNRRAFTIVGIAPRGFTGTLRGICPNLWLPVAAQAEPRLEARGARELLAIGRLRPGVSAAAAGAELAVVARRLAAAYPETSRGIRISAVPEHAFLFHEAPQLAYVNGAIFALFGIVLLIACVNLGGLMLARASFRRQEMTIRAALGATRRDLIGQLLTESLLLGILGGGVGLVLGMGLRNLLWHWIDRSVARSVGLDALWLDGGIDARLAAFTLALALISTVVFGLAPALDASRPGLYGLIKGAVPSSPGLGRFGRLRTLVAVQVALSVLLLSCAGLLVRTLERASRTDVGYPVDDVYVTTLDLTPGGYQEPTPVFERLCQHLRRMPGVDGVALAGQGWPGYLPHNATATGERQNYVVAAVGSGFFDVSRIPILTGREFRDEDREGAPRVAILNQKLAEALWPGENPVGRQLTVWDGKPPLLVVGLAKTVNSMPIGPPFYMIYLPFAQNPRAQMTIHLRASAAGSLTARAIEKEIRGMGLALPSIRVQTLRESLALSFSILRAGIAALAALGLLALLLGAVGLYGVTAYTASRRTQEIGIRRALGADRLSIYRLIVSGSMRAVGVGLGLGVVLSLLAGAVMKAAFLGSAYDPVALLAAPVLLALTALLAASLPALRASAVDPMIVLREE